METKDLLASLVARRAEIAAIQEKAKTQAKELFETVSKQLFEKHPEMESFGWKQYTPYFNDGDECRFSAHTDEPDINGIRGYEIHEARTYSTGSYPAKHEELVKAKDIVTEFLGNFYDSDLKDMFGDHVKITVSKDGIEVDDYDHE